MQLQGKKVWVTGASSGIGRAIAEQVAREGGDLILSARSENILNELKVSVETPRTNVTVAPIDFGDREQALPRANEIVASAAGIDILIYAAGISTRAPVEEAELDVYRSVMEVNYFGMISAVKSVLPQMLERESGIIVAISSVAGKVGSKNRSGYSGSKYAVCGFMDCLRAEVRYRGIHCLTVCPGYVRTNIARNALRADGQPRGESTPEIDGGMDSAECASRILRAMESQKDEVVIARGMGRWAPLLKRIVPGLVNRMVARRNW